MKSRLPILLLLSCLALLAVEPEFRLTYSIFFPATHIHTKLAREWAQAIHERTQGRVQIDIYPGCVLSGAGENYECVTKGVSDLGMSCFSYSRGMFPLIEGLDLPLGYRDGKQATRIANAYFRKFRPKELDETEVMLIHSHGPGLLATRPQVRRVADIKGLSIRGTGISAMVIRALGGNAIGMGQPDTYEALRKGVVDATLCPIETLKGWKQGEVIDSVVRIPSAGYTTAMFVVMNRDTWRSLPADIQQIFRQANEEWIPRHGQAWDDADKAGEEFVRSLGKSVSTLAPDEDAIAAKAIQPVLEAWAASVDKRGLPGHEALAFLQEQIRLQDNPPLAPLPPPAPAPDAARRRPWHLGWLLTVYALLAVAGVFTIKGGAAQEAFWRVYQNVAARLAFALALVSGLSLLAIIALTLADIVGRKLGCPLRGAIDIAQLLAGVSTATALPYVTALKGHIAVEFFFQRLPPRRRVFWDTISRLAVITFFLYLAITAFQQGSRLLAKHAVGLSIAIPIFWIQWVMAAAFCLTILVVAFNLMHPGKAMIQPKA